MSTQPEALRLADVLDAGKNFYAESSLWYDRKLSDAVDAAAAELRRLYAVNQELLEWSRAVVRYAGNSCDDYLADQASAAIDKAEGQA